MRNDYKWTPYISNEILWRCKIDHKVWAIAWKYFKKGLMARSFSQRLLSLIRNVWWWRSLLQDRLRGNMSVWKSFSVQRNYIPKRSVATIPIKTLTLWTHAPLDLWSATQLQNHSHWQPLIPNNSSIANALNFTFHAYAFTWQPSSLGNFLHFNLRPPVTLY